MKYVLGCFMLCALVCTGCASTKSKKTEAVGQTEAAVSAPKQGVEKVSDRAAEKAIREKYKNNPNTDARFDVKYEVLFHGSNAAVGSCVIRSTDELNGLCSFSADMKKKYADFDFSKKAIVIASAGRFNTGGYAVDLASAVLENGRLNLTFAVSSPGPYDIVTQALTYPFVAVAVAVDENTDITMNIIGAGKSDAPSRVSQ